jgi:hypothetical protein
LGSTCNPTQILWLPQFTHHCNLGGATVRKAHRSADELGGSTGSRTLNAIIDKWF